MVCFSAPHTGGCTPYNCGGLDPKGGRDRPFFKREKKKKNGKNEKKTKLCMKILNSLGIQEFYKNRLKGKAGNFCVRPWWVMLITDLLFFHSPRENNHCQHDFPSHSQFLNQHLSNSIRSFNEKRYFLLVSHSLSIALKRLGKNFLRFILKKKAV